MQNLLETELKYNLDVSAEDLDKLESRLIHYLTVKTTQVEKGLEQPHTDEYFDDADYTLFKKRQSFRKRVYENGSWEITFKDRHYDKTSVMRRTEYSFSERDSKSLEQIIEDFKEIDLLSSDFKIEKSIKITTKRRPYLITYKGQKLAITFDSFAAQADDEHHTEEVHQLEIETNEAFPGAFFAFKKLTRKLQRKFKILRKGIETSSKYETALRELEGILYIGN
jgi:hypothetical protein